MGSYERNKLAVRKKGGRGTELATSASDELYGKCLAEVFKGYLPYVKEAYRVIPCEDELPPTDSVASFDITKLVLEKDDRLIERLKNVYHLLADSDDSIALIVNRTNSEARISLAVSAGERNSEEAMSLAECVRDALLGNFPGSECSKVVHFSDENDGAFCPLNENASFSYGGFNSVGIVSNIATEFSEGFVTQGIEKLVDGVLPEEGKEYTIVLIGESVDAPKVEARKEHLHRLCTAMSPFAKRTMNWGVNESTTWTESVNVGGSVFGAIPGVPIMGSLTAGASLAHAGTKGTSEGQSVDVVEFGVQHVIDTIKKQIDRIEQCEALGFWEFGAYVFSADYELVNEVTHMYKSLTQGSESFYERPAINIWNAQADRNNEREEIGKLREYVRRLRHPRFEKTALMEDGGVFNEANWPDEVTCTAGVSGAELARAMNLPRKSVAGLPVIECAPFGREITSYDRQVRGDVAIGKIHHMHHDEDRLVALSSESLASHVFVTGSTGSGKSNTVYRLLSQAGRNFLVIEPAKGEYRFAFGPEVRYYGTNFMIGELLRVNPFEFPEGIHVYEHIDRLLEVFNVCWPMYAAMPAVLKDAVICSYERCGWDLRGSRNPNGNLYPTFADVCDEIDSVIESSDYSDENKGNYRGSLKTRLKSLTNGINGLLFCEGSIPDAELFDSKAIVDLSRVGSAENKSLIMGVLVIKLQEHRMCQRSGQTDEGLKHITVLEEAHNLLRSGTSSSSPEMGGGMAAKSVEMLANAIAEMRTYGEGFVIVDQAPGLLDMSAIRNTNTKIIMRLPDLSDRELVGHAANLDDSQVLELARLQKGVAAIYQNEWVEPVLCHVDRHEKPAAGVSCGAAVDDAARVVLPEGLSDAEERYLNTCIYDPRYLTRKSDISFVDCVQRFDAPDSEKALLMEYARTPLGSLKGIYEKAAFRRFGIEEALEEGVSSDCKWDDILVRRLAGFRFMEDAEFERSSDAWMLFSQTMLAQAMLWVSGNLKNPERTETAERLWKGRFA